MTEFIRELVGPTMLIFLLYGLWILKKFDDTLDLAEGAIAYIAEEALKSIRGGKTIGECDRPN